MREIKFRGLRTDGKGWVEGSLLQSEISTNGYCECAIVDRFSMLYDTARHEVIPESVGQFTGLHDKNGKDIYEGDGVKFSVRRNYSEVGLQTIIFKSVVEWDEGCFMITESDKNDTYLYAHSAECEIIGNIHESEVSND